MSNFRAESHVAQQRRRDKLRIQHNSDPTHHLQDFSNNLEQLSVHQGPSPDLTHLRNLKYDPSVFSSEMLNYVTKNMVVHQESTAAQPARPMAGDHISFAHLPHPILSNPNSLAKVSGDPQNCSTWKSIGSQQSCDWVVNYPNTSTATESNQNQNQNPIFVGDGFSNSLKINNISESSHYLRPIQSSSISSNPCSEIFSHQNSQKHYDGEMHFNSSPFYQNTLQEVVTSATIGTQGLEMASLAQPNDANELLLLPNYGDQSSPVCLENASTWINRPVEGVYQWNGRLDFLANRSTNDNSSTQGLSLSLSSVPPAKSHEESQLDVSEDIRSRTSVLNHLQDSKAFKSDYLCSNSKPSIGSKGFGNTCQIVGTSAFSIRNAGPLGPFTGYAIILNSSKFMNPTQQLLDEFCSVTCPKPLRTCEVYSNERISEEVRISADAINADESMVGAKDGDSGASSSTFYSSNDISGEVAGGRSSSTESYRPEYHQKKAKLLYLQGEVCTRYKQYHQQMQMVVSSFKSVAGLSAATPYISLALKTVSRHFRCLKNAISDQLGHIRKALGEDISFPIAGTSSSKGDTSTSRLKFIDHSFQKHKSGGSNSGFFEPQPPVWRPQRGLPERAVAILRAWLFDHFLHPYPTDTDKHMLATQTGLTRNQVSNWFINARVRVWKPMVEEIHSLETKSLAEPNSNTRKTDGKPGLEGANGPIDDQSTNRLRVSSMSNEEVECSGIGSSAEHRNQEKRSRVECQIPSTMDGSLMGFVPYERSPGLEIGGLGAVSLTLGLRQSVESAQQQQQQLQQPEHQHRLHFGGQMIHDFGG